MTDKMADVWITQTTYKKNATDGIAVHKSRQELAGAVLNKEAGGGSVRVFELVECDHEAYVERAGITLARRKGD